MPAGGAEPDRLQARLRDLRRVDRADGFVDRLRARGIEAATRVGYATAAEDVGVRLSGSELTR